jgi:ferredoxin
MATIFYFSGTGNALWVARTIAASIGNDTKLLSMVTAKTEDLDFSLSGDIGLIFPVHIWGLPTQVKAFINRFSFPQSSYTFAVAVHGGQVSGTLLELKKLLLRKGVVLSIGYEILTPSNYIPWGGPPSVDIQNNYFDAGSKKITHIVDVVKKRGKGIIEKGPLWQRIVFTSLNRISISRVPMMDSKFWVDEKCNECGVCARICPVKNITNIDAKPTWHHQCTQCLACIQWCPQEAIQYGKKTLKYARYHNPQVTLGDILKQNSK